MSLTDFEVMEKLGKSKLTDSYRFWCVLECVQSEEKSGWARVRHEEGGH